MALQGGKTKSNKSKPSLWSLLVKKPGNGSGDGHVIGSPSVYDRRHHIMLLQLISPLLYDVPYPDSKMKAWFTDVKFVECARITDNDFNAKLAKQAWTEAYLFVELYNEYLTIASDTLWNNVKNTENKHSTLDPILDDLSQFQWFEDLCRTYRNSYNLSTQKQVSAALLICIYHYHLTESLGQDVVQCFEDQCAENMEICGNYRTAGNDYFKNESWEQALTNYSKGLKLHQYHEVLYSNRSQTYLKLLKYKEAEFDAARAICLKCDRPKSYLRLVESVEKQGNTLQALELATEGLDMCEETVNSDEHQALLELIASLKKKLNLSSGDSTEVTASNAVDAIRIAIEQGVNIVRMSIISEPPDTSGLPELLSTDSESEGFAPYSGQTVPVPKLRKAKKFRPRTNDAATWTPDVPNTMHESKPNAPPTTIHRQRSDSETRISIVEFKANIADASVALLAQQCRQASYFYGKALKDLSCLDGQLSEKEIVIIKYASASAFSNSGVYTDMMKALSLFEEIIEHHKRVSFPLTYYGMACCYCKQNRFKDALVAIHKCLDAIESKPLDGSLTWPGTAVVIIENEGLKDALHKLEETCKNPPRPDALCRYDKGDHVKPEIYLSDPDFKGYIKVTCLERCILQYHPNCWKSLKEELLQTNDKEFLGKECLTPDCESCIIEIGHIGTDGEVSKKFVHHSENVTRTGTKQKRSKLEKKLQAKKQKKIQKAAAETVVEQDVDSLQDEAADASMDRESGVALEDNKDAHALPHNKENNTGAVLAASVPIKQLSHPSSAKMDGTKPPLSMGKAVILKKDEDEVVKSKAPAHRSDRQRKKDKRKQVLTIDEFLGTHNEVAFVSKYAQRLSKLHAQRNRVEEGKNAMCISPNTFLQLDQDEPFHIPEHLRQDYEDVQRMMSSTTEEESATARAIKENFVSYMKDFMKETGPLHLEDPRLMEEMANLPVELQELIVNAGGFKEFMVKSQQFIVLQDRIYCLDYTPRGMDVASQFFDFKMNNNSTGTSEHGSSIGEKRSKGKVDSLDSFDVEADVEPAKQIGISEVKHDSSSESEVSDSDLMYESDKTEDSCSEASKDPKDDFRDQQCVIGEDSSDDEDDDDDEVSDYSDDEIEEGLDYESDGSSKNRTVVEVKRDDFVECHDETESKISSNNEEKTSLQLPKVDNANARAASIEHPPHTARSGSLDSTSSSSCDLSISSERPNAMDFSRRRYLDKFLQFVPRFSEKGQGQVLYLLLRIIQNEDILHQHMKDTAGFPVDAMESTIRNLTIAAGVLHPVSHKAVQTQPDEDESRLKMENSQYQDKVDELLRVVQQLEATNQSIEPMKQEYTATLQQRDQDLADTRSELSSAQEQLESLTKAKITVEQKLEEVQATLNKLRGDLDGERRLRMQAHDLSRRLQAELTVSKSAPPAQEKPQVPVNSVPGKTEVRNGELPVALMSLKVQPPQPIPMPMPHTVPWSSLNLPPPTAGYTTSGNSLSGRPLITSIPVPSMPIVAPLKPQALGQALSARNGSSNHNNVETAATKSISSPIPTIKQQPSPCSRVALDDFDDSKNASAAASSKPAASGQVGKTCKPSNSEPEMKRGPPMPQPQASAQAHPPASSSSKNSFEKLMGMLQPTFPNCSRDVLRKLVQQLRARRGNTLTGLTMEQIVQELGNMIVKQKQGAIPKPAMVKAPFSSASMGLDRIAEPGLAWQKVPAEKHQWEVNQTEEDPCIICHEEMVGKDICQLQCLHRFHPNCIRQWFREQSTCPTCRVHSILPDEFPPLA